MTAEGKGEDDGTETFGDAGNQQLVLGQPLMMLLQMMIMRKQLQS